MLQAEALFAWFRSIDEARADLGPPFGIPSGRH